MQSNPPAFPFFICRVGALWYQWKETGALEHYHMIGILIVDDNPEIRVVLRKGLDDQGDVRVVGEAADGIAAVQLAHSLRPDVVLIDVGMARLDGVETTRRLRSLLPQTVLIGMSCHTRDMVEHALLSAGADVFLPKETLLDDLLPSIRKALQRRA